MQAPFPTASATANRADWLTARRNHLDAERAFTKARDELSAARRRLPWLLIDEDYTFDTPTGAVSLVDLFDGQRQLVVYHFMMGPDWEEGCPACSFWADNYDGTQVHLAHRDTALVTVSRTSVDNIEAYRRRMDWNFRWVSSLNTTFNFDMGVSFTEEQRAADSGAYNYGVAGFSGPEAAGISTFIRDDDDRVFLTYQTFSRGLDMANTAYHLLDMTALGRHEDNLDWSMQWLRRHDAYPD